MNKVKILVLKILLGKKMEAVNLIAQKIVNIVLIKVNVYIVKKTIALSIYVINVF